MEPKNQISNIQFYTLDGEPLLPISIESATVTMEDLEWSYLEPSWFDKEFTIELDIKDMPPVLREMLERPWYLETVAKLRLFWVWLESIRLGYSQPLLPPEAPNP